MPWNIHHYMGLHFFTILSHRCLQFLFFAHFENPFLFFSIFLGKLLCSPAQTNKIVGFLENSKKPHKITKTVSSGKVSFSHSSPKTQFRSALKMKVRRRRRRERGTRSWVTFFPNRRKRKWERKEL